MKAKVNSSLSKLARQTQELLASLDFVPFNALDCSKIRAIVDMIAKDVPKELELTATEAKYYLHIMAEGANNRRTDAGLQAGIKIGLLLAELSKYRPIGPEESPVCEILRTLHSAAPNGKQSAKVADAVASFEKESGRKMGSRNREKLKEYLEKNYRKIIQRHVK